MESAIKNFEDLRIWQDGVELAVNVYALFKDCKDWGLRDQVQRFAVSISSNLQKDLIGIQTMNLFDFSKYQKPHVLN